MESETTRYLSLLIRRWWIIILVAVIAGVGAYILRSRQPDTYIAEAKVFIGNAINTLNPDQTLLDTGERLATTYEQIVRFSSILNPVIEELDLDITFEEFRNLIITDVIQNTPILTVGAESDTPEMAATIANAVADSLIQNSPADLTADQLELLRIQQQQIDSLNAQISEAQAQLIEIGQQLIDATNPDRIVQLTAQRNRLREQLQTDQATFTQLSQAFSGLSDRTNKLEVLEPAIPPLEPTGLSPLIIAVAGAITGALAAVAAILFFGYIDNKIRNESDARRLLSLPVLGQISSHRGYNPKSLAKGVESAASTGVLEQYRTALASAMLAQDARERERIYLVSSPDRREGRTFTAAHLAAAAASTGLRVLLIDADLRNPDLHELLGQTNSDGVIALLTLTNAKPELFEKPAELEALLGKHIKKTAIPNVDFIPSGANRNANAALPNLDQLGKVLGRTSAMGYDIVVLDTAGSLKAADGYVLATALNANVILIIDSGRTTRENALKAKEQFALVGSHISGLIMNRA